MGEFGSEIPSASRDNQGVRGLRCGLRNTILAKHLDAFGNDGIAMPEDSRPRDRADQVIKIKNIRYECNASIGTYNALHTGTPDLARRCSLRVRRKVRAQQRIASSPFITVVVIEPDRYTSTVVQSGRTPKHRRQSAPLETYRYRLGPRRVQSLEGVHSGIPEQALDGTDPGRILSAMLAPLIARILPRLMNSNGVAGSGLVTWNSVSSKK